MSIRALIADDEPKLGEYLAERLAELWPELELCGIAANGREALEYAIQACPDVAVIDVSMPEMDGIEASRYIRDYCPKTSIVMLSMYNNPDYIRRALRAGARGYVLKDAVGRGELVAAVRTLAAGRKYFSADIAEVMEDL